MLFVSQEIDGQWQTTPGQHGDRTLVAQRTDQTIEGHGGDMPNDRTQLQTQPAMRRQQDITGHLGSYGAITEDEMREDREHGLAHGALDTPDGETAEPETGIVGVAGQA